MTAEPLLLADLCKICHTNPPKYRCPRCSTRTCSLTCTKRHKLWAQCNGIRDPAAYKRRDQLETASSIDQDYNFISGIERSLEGADRDSRARGVPVKEKTVVRDGPVKGEVNLRQALERSGVRVEKAPVGMSRSKLNRTGWNRNQRCISWTIEWVLDEGRKVLGNCLDNQIISEAYARDCQPSQARKQPPKKKRKTKAAGPPNHDGAPITNAVTDPLRPSSPEPIPIPPPPTPSELPSPRSQPPPPLHFYLHIPHPPSPTKKPTLLPLSPTSTLSSILSQHTILEFPTIYVLKQTPENLPDNLTLLEEKRGGEVEDLLMALGAELEGEGKGESVKSKVEEEEAGSVEGGRDGKGGRTTGAGNREEGIEVEKVVNAIVNDITV